jgi:hypothetical protein
MNTFQRMNILIQRTPFLSVLNNTVSVRQVVRNVTLENDFFKAKAKLWRHWGPTAKHLVIQSSNQESGSSNHGCPTVYLLRVPLEYQRHTWDDQWQVC